MSFVLDASIVMDWALEEADATAAMVWERLKTDTALSPTLLWFEVRNGLIVAERRGRISDDRSAAFLKQLAEFPIAVDAAPEEAAVMALARRHRLTVYDAAYLELALRERVPLATLDGPLAAAARAEHVALLGA
jgi:predicted nucleic acid-binding protein